MATATSPGGLFSAPQHRVDLPVVRDCHGKPVMLVRVPPGEQTCTVCGETVASGVGYCQRCSDADRGIFVRKLVPTTSYLRDDEFVTQ